MTTKIITYDFPINENDLAEELGNYMNDGFILTSITPIPEIDSGSSTFRAHLLIILHKYNISTNTNMFPPFTVSSEGKYT